MRPPRWSACENGNSTRRRDIVRKFAMIQRILLAIAAALLWRSLALAQPPDVKGTPHGAGEGQPLPAGAIARIGSPAFRTGWFVAGLAYAPDGKSLAIQSLLEVQIWDAANGTLRHRLQLAEDKPLQCPTGDSLPRAMVVHPDSKRIDVLFSAGDLWTFDVQNGKVLEKRAIPGERALGLAAFSRNRSVLAFGGPGGAVRVLDSETVKEICPEALEEKQKLRQLAITPDGGLVARSTTTPVVEVFDVGSGKRLFELESDFKPLPGPDMGTLLRFSPDSKRLISQESRGPIIVWDLRTGKEVTRITGLGPLSVARAAFSPDGQRVAVDALGADLEIRLYDAATGARLRTFPRAWTAQVRALAFSPDGKSLAVGDDNGTVNLWDVESEKRLPITSDPLGVMEVSRFAERDRRLWIVAANRFAIYDWKTGRLVEQFDANTGGQALSPDGKKVAQPDGKGIALKDARTGVVVGRAGQEVRFPQPLLIRFTPDGKKLLYVDREAKTIHVWDLAAGKLVHILAGHKEEIQQLVVSPDGRWLASAAIGRPDKAMDGGLLLWDLVAGKLVQRMGRQHEYVARLAFSGDAHEIALEELRPSPDETGVARQWLRFLDVPTGAVKRSFPAERGARGFVYSPDRRTLAVWTGAETIYLWETATGKTRHEFRGHIAPIERLVMSGDGALLAASSRDAPILIWDVYGKHAAKPAPAEEWTAGDEELLWQGLAGNDAAPAFQTIRRLIGQPQPAVALLAKRLAPVEDVDGKKVARWLADLDSEDFDTRSNANAELEKLGERVEVALRETWVKNPTLETKRRLEALIAKAEVRDPERVRSARALEALEQIATPDAAKLLERLAAGAPTARLTQEAAEALERVRKR
jgi:WD40 repeat protein